MSPESPGGSGESVSLIRGNDRADLKSLIRLMQEPRTGGEKRVRNLDLIKEIREQPEARDPADWTTPLGWSPRLEGFAGEVRGD